MCATKRSGEFSQFALAVARNGDCLCRYPKRGTQLYLECATRHRVYVTHAVSH